MEQLKRLQFIEQEMISEGKSPSEIDAAKASLREQSFSGIPPELSGVASLSETALNMNRGPRGLNSLQRFADGGPVTSMRPRSRPTNDETEAEQLAASSEAFGDNELLADLMPILQNDPLAMLGYDPKIMRFDQPIGSSRAFYDPRSDTIHYGADYGSSFEVIVHELRHRGTQILRNQALKNPENFKERYGTAAYNFTSGLKGRTEANINQNSEQITNFGDKGTDEWINELLDNPDNFVYNAPFINEDGSTGSERVNDSYVVEYADKDALRSFRKTGEYPEAGRGPEGRYGSIGVPRRGLVRDRRGFGNTTTEYLNMTPYEKSKLITREYNLPSFTDQINPSEITKGISGMKQAATDLLQGQKEDGIFYADGGEVMNGIGSLNETARGMSRGPRGIGAYQQFADGGPVYMAEGGLPMLPQGGAPLASNRRPGDIYLPPDPNSMGGPTSEGRFVGQGQMPRRSQMPLDPQRLQDLQMRREPPAPMEDLNPFSSGVRGDGMSANDLQRMLSRQTIAPENVADTEADILSLQQAEVANRANVPPPPPQPSTGIATAVPSPFGPGSPYGPGSPFGPGSPYGPLTGPGSPYGREVQPYGREVQPYGREVRDYGREVQPTSYGIGSFGQPMQQQGFGSNKPTANVLF